MRHSLPPRRIGNHWIVVGLLLAFLTTAYFAERYGQSISDANSVSTLNARSRGTKALYKLFDALPYHVDRLTNRWGALDETDGLLVVIEPFDDKRSPDAKELDQLRQWAERGGTILYCATAPARPLDKKDPVAGDVAILDATPEESNLEPSANSRSITPLLANIESITVNSSVRLQPAGGGPYTTLFEDRQGIVAARKAIGKGQLIVLSDTFLVSNAGIAKTDNVVFLANIARSAVSDSRENIVFDEYHHGFGAELPIDEENWLTTLPLPVKRASWMGLVLLLLLVYNSARRFGPPSSLPSNASPTSTDYVTSLARWHRRADASDIVLRTLLQDTKRVMIRRLDLAPDLLAQPVDLWVGEVEHRLANKTKNETKNVTEAETAQIVQTLLRCEELAAGLNVESNPNETLIRISRAEFMALAGQLEEIKRRLNVVGTQ